MTRAPARGEGVPGPVATLCPPCTCAHVPYLHRARHSHLYLCREHPRGSCELGVCDESDARCEKL